MRTTTKRLGKWVAAGLILLWAQNPGCTYAGGLPGDSAENLSVTEYDDTQPIVKIHAARTFLDHERYGFFRFRLAQLAVVEGVEVQIESARRLTNVLESVNSWNLSSGTLRRLEFRNLEISLFGEKEPRLRVAMARPTASGTLELSKVSLTGAVPAFISKATLQVVGPAAGRLRWRDGAKENELFVLKASEFPKS